MQAHPHARTNACTLARTIAKTRFPEDVYNAFSTGLAPHNGYSLPSGEIVDSRKLHKMLWALEQAHRQRKQTWIRSATCVNLLRDERHGRLHIRFRCSDASATCFSGYLGQSREHKPSSIGINEATREVLTDFCTLWQSPPAECALAPTFDQELFRHLSRSIEAISIDSASNEKASVKDMLNQGVTPNCRHILYDAPHKARRVLSRPWRADETLGNVVGLFCHWRWSMGQLVHHSHDLKKLYTDCVDATMEDAAASSRFGNLRCAKHRIETEVTPLSRSVLNLSAFILFAVKLGQIRRGEPQGRAADMFLETLCPELIVLLAMMADAGSEALHFIRAMDREGLSLADMTAEMGAFLDRIAWLFHRDGCLHMDGHTAYALQWLSEPHFYMVRGQGRCIGGMEVDPAILRRSLAHLQSWTALAEDVLRAEFPEFDLCSSFSVFRLPKERSVRARPLTEDERRKLGRLSSTFGQAGLEAQFRDHYPFACAAYERTSFQCDYAEAWKAAVEITSAIKGSNHPSGDLLFVLQRYVCFTPSTSGIEQSFSLIQSKLSDRRLNAAANTENQSISLFLAKLSDTELNELCKDARRVWAAAWPLAHARVHKTRRVDYGIPADKGGAEGSGAQEDAHGKLSERAFLKRAHREVVAFTPEGCRNLLREFEPNVWSDAHQHEREFQASKRQKRLIEARRVNAGARFRRHSLNHCVAVRWVHVGNHVKT